MLLSQKYLLIQETDTYLTTQKMLHVAANLIKMFKISKTLNLFQILIAAVKVQQLINLTRRI